MSYLFVYLEHTSLYALNRAVTPASKFLLAGASIFVVSWLAAFGRLFRIYHMMLVFCVLNISVMFLLIFLELSCGELASEALRFLF